MKLLTLTLLALPLLSTATTPQKLTVKTFEQNWENTSYRCDIHPTKPLECEQEQNLCSEVYMGTQIHHNLCTPIAKITEYFTVNENQDRYNIKCVAKFYADIHLLVIKNTRTKEEFSTAFHSAEACTKIIDNMSRDDIKTSLALDSKDESIKLYF